MCQVIEKYAVLQMIEAFGFCRFVFRKFGFDIERGLILVVEDTCRPEKSQMLFVRLLLQC